MIHEAGIALSIGAKSGEEGIASNNAVKLRVGLRAISSAAWNVSTGATPPGGVAAENSAGHADGEFTHGSIMSARVFSVSSHALPLGMTPLLLFMRVPAYAAALCNAGRLLLFVANESVETVAKLLSAYAVATVVVWVISMLQSAPHAAGATAAIAA